MKKINASIVIPTYNGGEVWHTSAKAISQQLSQVDKVLVIDSSSKDDTIEIANEYNFVVDIIPSSEFNHGGTRNKGVRVCHSDIVIFLTQDAIPKSDCIEKILQSFTDPIVACAYGRQLPHTDANPLAIHARNFNYKENDYIGSLDSKEMLGLKAVFMSNSFSAYRVSIFNALGGFPENTILCEDMYLAAKAVLANYKVAYVSDAEVYHSHNYRAIDEFKRYFDIGVFHQDEPWIHESFGGAEREGKNFILSELSYLLKNAPLWVPVACVNNFSKIFGYKLGQNYKKISPKWRRRLSMHKRYWDNVSN
ncbi:glycosyltransferase [Serratia proteamaculans]|uniref:glycosyltransferase family 2 protein n=1 Tax=Serratia proteamaculans TaxID=28151 RepID=UPI0021A681C5